MTVERVFNTTELLEAVLLRLPFKEIFKAQAVTRRSREVVDKSQALRRAMHVSPKGRVLHPLDPSQMTRPTLSPPSSKLPLMEHTTFDTAPIFAPLECRTFNTVRTELRWPWRYCVSREYRDCSIHILTLELDVDDRIQIPPVYRSIYLTQPPISAVSVSSRDYENPPAVVAYDKNGLTFGAIEQVIRSAFTHRRKRYPTHPPANKVVWASFMQPKDTRGIRNTFQLNHGM